MERSELTSSYDSDKPFIFKSKSGKKYNSELFISKNIEKLFLTVQLQKPSSSISDVRTDDQSELNKNGKFATVTEKLNHLGVFNVENSNMKACKRLKISMHFSSTEDVHPQKKSSGMHFPSTEVVLSQKKKSSPVSSYDNDAVSSNNRKNSVQTCDPFHCVNCFREFSNITENYNHTCNGKGRKGFMCMFCEKIISTYEELRKHYWDLHEVSYMHKI